MTEPSFTGPGVDEPQLRAVPVADTPLESLREALSTPSTSDFVVFSHPGRPSVKVRYSTLISYDDLAAWRKAARDDSHLGGVHQVRFACIVLANCSEAILVDGHDSGQNLASQGLRDLYKVSDSIEVVRAFFDRRDGWVTATRDALLVAAGYGEQVEAEPDPTTPPQEPSTI